MRDTKMIRKSLIAGLLISIAAIPRAQSQTYVVPAEQSALLAGVVTDITGAVIPKAEITLIAVGKSVTATTGEDGQFSIHANPGDYLLKVFSMGFRPYEQLIHWPSSSKEPIRIALQISEGGGPCFLPCGNFFENPPVPVLQSSLSSTIPLKTSSPTFASQKKPQEAFPLRQAVHRA